MQECLHIVKRPSFQILLILVLALGGRLYFFTGYTNAWTQDETIYFFNISDLAKDNSIYAEHTRLADTLDPSVTFSTRLTFLYAQAFILRLFHFSSNALFVLPMVCSLLDIYLMYCIGKALSRPRSGILAAFLLAMTPIHIHYSSRIMPEQMLSLLFDVSVFLFLSYLNSRSLLKVCLIACSLGAGMYVKEVMPLVTMIFFLILVVRKDFKGASALLAVTLMITALFSLFFLHETGNPNYYFDVLQKTRYSKFLQGVEEASFLGLFRFIYEQDYNIVFHLENLFSPTGFRFLTWGYPYGALFVLFAFLTPLAVYKSKKGTLLVGIVVAYILFLEFGFVACRFSEGQVLLYMIMKEIPDGVRYPHFLCGLAAVVSGLGFEAIKIRTSWLRQTIMVILIMLVSLVSTAASIDIRRYLTEPVSDLKDMMTVLRPMLRDKGVHIYFTDVLAEAYFTVSTNGKYKDRKRLLIDPKQISEHEDASTNIVVVGGSRSADIEGGTILERPELLSRLKLTPIYRLKKPLTNSRAYNMVIYEIISSKS